MEVKVLILRTHFEELLKNLKPSQERLDAAKTLPKQVRDFLKEHEEFATAAPHSRLAGSYAQNMSAGDVKDVDFLVRVPGDPEKNEPEAKQLLKDLKSTLNELPEALGYEGCAGIDIEGARRSVHVYFEGEDFHLDVVPCIAPDGFEESLFVPYRGFNKWVPSHPIGYIALLNSLNTENGGKVKHLGILLKHFRNHQMKNRKPKSYWLGALLIHLIQDEKLDTSEPIAVLFRDMLDAIYDKYVSLLGRTDGATPNIPDPMLGHNISWNWSRTHFETFMRRLDDGRTWATKALETDDHDKAIEWWQKIFGEEYFPSNVEKALARLASEGMPGKATVAATGLIYGSKSDVESATPSQPTKYHGSKAN